MSGHSENLDIMRDIRSLDESGRPIYDPMPPRQHARLLLSRDPVEKLMGWMFMHTIRYRPTPHDFDEAQAENFKHRTPYASGEDGRPLSLKHIAADFDWPYRRTVKVWKQAVERKLVEDRGGLRGGALFLRGDVPVPVAILGDEVGETPHVSALYKQYCESFPPYLRAQLEALGPEKQAEFVEVHKRARGFCRRAEADAMMAVRDAWSEPLELQVFKRFGIDKQIGTKQEEARKECWVQLQLFAVPDLEALLRDEPSSTTAKSTVDRSTSELPKAPPTREAERSATPAGNIASSRRPTPDVPVVDDPLHTPESFHDVLCVRFKAVGAGLPARRQTDPVYRELGPRVAGFLKLFSALEFQRRKPDGGGILKLWLGEFLKAESLPVPKPATIDDYWQRRAREVGHG